MRLALLSFVAGLASATGFAPLGLWPVTLACLALLLHLVERAPSLRSALSRGWLFGLGHFTVGLNWIAHAFTFQDAMPHWFGYGAVILLSVYLAVFPAAAAGLAWRWGVSTSLDTNGSKFALIFAASWIVTEWLRATLFTGFAWNPLAVVLVGSQLALASGWIGTYGLSAIVVASAGAMLALAHKRWRAFAALVAFPALALVVAASFARSDDDADRPLIRIVQPNIPTDEKYEFALNKRNFRKLAALSGRPGAEPRLILWPEGSIPEPPYLEESAIARRRLASLLGPRDILMAGGTKRHRRSVRRGDFIEEYTVGGRNATYAIDARGTLLDRYDKAHLVPYGEYLPARPVLTSIGLSRLIPGDIDFWPGPGPRSVALPGFGKVGGQICYEIVFSGQVIDRANRPDFVFNPSNDAWFGDWGPPQHLAQARLRAIEEAMPIVRSTPTGISAVIDADGRLLESIPHETAGFIETRLPAPRAPSLFARLGNILPLGFALLLAALGVALRRRSR